MLGWSPDKACDPCLDNSYIYTWSSSSFIHWASWLSSYQSFNDDDDSNDESGDNANDNLAWSISRDFDYNNSVNLGGLWSMMTFCRLFEVFPGAFLNNTWIDTTFLDNSSLETVRFPLLVFISLSDKVDLLSSFPKSLKLMSSSSFLLQILFSFNSYFPFSRWTFPSFFSESPSQTWFIFRRCGGTYLGLFQLSDNPNAAPDTVYSLVHSSSSFSGSSFW